MGFVVVPVKASQYKYIMQGIANDKPFTTSRCVLEFDSSLSDLPVVSGGSGVKSIPVDRNSTKILRMYTTNLFVPPML